jgi:tetratricopeptide (TPR) repeat protein
MAPLVKVRRAIPATLQSAIGRQFEQLPTRTRALLQAAAQVGTRFSARLVASAAGFAEEQAISLLEHLEATRMIVTREGAEEWPDGTSTETYRFRHQLDVEALRRNTLPAAAGRMQRRIIAELQRLFADRQSEIATDLAHRCAIARDWPGAIEYLRVAAETAAYRGEPKQAVRLLRRAMARASKLPAKVQLKSTIPLLERLATILSISGERLPAASAFKTLAARAARARLEEVETRALVRLLQQAVWFSHERALAQADRTLRWTRSRPEVPARAELEFHALVVRLLFQGWNDAEADRCETLAASKGLADIERARMQAHLVFQRCIRSDYERALSIGDEAQPILMGQSDWVSLEYIGYSRVVTLLHSGRWGELADVLEASLESARRHSNVEERVMTSLLTSWLEVEARAFWPALERAERAIVDPAADVDSAIMVQMGRVVAGTAALGLGLHDRAAEHLEHLNERQRAERMMADWYWRTPLLIALSELALQRGHRELAATQAEEAVLNARRTPDRSWRARALAARAGVHLASGRTADARRDLAGALREIRRLHGPPARWRVFESLALLHERQGNLRRADAARRRRGREIDALASALSPGHYLTPSLHHTLHVARAESAHS